MHRLKVRFACIIKVATLVKFTAGKRGGQVCSASLEWTQVQVLRDLVEYKYSDVS